MRVNAIELVSSQQNGIKRTHYCREKLPYLAIHLARFGKLQNWLEDNLSSSDASSFVADGELTVDGGYSCMTV